MRVLGSFCGAFGEHYEGPDRCHGKIVRMDIWVLNSCILFVGHVGSFLFDKDSRPEDAGRAWIIWMGLCWELRNRKL